MFAHAHPRKHWSESLPAIHQSHSKSLMVVSHCNAAACFPTSCFPSCSTWVVKTRCGVSRTLASDPQPHRLRILCSSPSPHFYPHPDVLVLLLSSTGPHLRPLWLIYRVQTINFVNASSPERFFHIQYLHWHGLTVLEFVSKLHCHTAQTSWKRPRLSKRLAKEGALPHDCNAMRRAGHNSKHHTCGLVNAELVTDIGWGFGIFAYHLNNLCTSIPNFILPLPN